MIRIAIADDHQMFIDGMKALIHSFQNINVVGEANSGNGILKVIESTETDIAMLDINMPDKDGIETAKEIRKNFPLVKVLMVSMYKQKEFISQLVAAGVSGYILKNTGADELYNAIRVIYDDGEYFGEEITQEILHALRNKHSMDDIATFSSREKEILNLLSNELTSQEIAEKLFISFNTVETHRKNMLAKAGVRNSVGLIRFGINHKLI
jgi:DNA-binding NarL/FixJ family response regulator